MLVAGVAGFEALALGRQLCREGCGAAGGGVVVPGSGAGRLLPGIGFGLGGEPQPPATPGCERRSRSLAGQFEMPGHLGETPA